jgi:F-type H+-transporting ATPase subunit b
MFSRIATQAVKRTTTSVLYRTVATTSGSKTAAPAATAATGAVASPRTYPHDAPERDFANFPPLRIPEEGGKVRIGVIPDEWFKAMYEKTGVTGPYVLFWGAVTTLLSKEYFVYWADTAEQIVFLTATIYLAKTYGPAVAKFLDDASDKTNNAAVQSLKDETSLIDTKISANKALTSLPEANTLINQAKRENVQLQLEANYRQRLANVAAEVRKRLDYQVSVQGVTARLEREQALNYIIGNVSKSIGAAQEKEAFNSGLSTLKGLSQKYAGQL